MTVSDDDLKKITDAVQEANHESVKEFYVDRERHYKHHEFIESLSNSFNAASSIIGRTILVAVVLFVLGLISFSFWMKYNERPSKPGNYNIKATSSIQAIK